MRMTLVIQVLTPELLTLSASMSTLLISSSLGFGSLSRTYDLAFRLRSVHRSPN
jgi:hypothetical protein